MSDNKSGEMTVLLNENAKRVNRRMKRTLQKAMPKVQLFSAKTMEESRSQLWQALDEGADSIVCGGGDGTVVHMLNEIRTYIDQKNLLLKEYMEEKNLRIKEFAQEKNELIKGYVDGKNESIKEYVDEKNEQLKVYAHEKNERLREYMDEQNQKIQELGDDVLRRLDEVTWPKIGILKLGTGNAWASVMGSKKPVTALRRMVKEIDLPTRKFHLVESENNIFHFSGLGWDAAVLNDYFAMKSKFDKGFLSPWFKMITGYITSMALRTIPKQMLVRNRPQVRVTNGGGDVYSVSRSGGVRYITDEPGAVLYEGPISVTGAATTTEYGFGLQAFPYADKKQGYFNFRMISASLREILTHVPGVFKGTYESSNIHDFLAKDICLEFDREMPYHEGGDPKGYRKEVRYKLTDFSVDVFDLQQPACGRA